MRSGVEERECAFGGSGVGADELPRRLGRRTFFRVALGPPAALIAPNRLPHLPGTNVAVQGAAIAAGAIPRPSRDRSSGWVSEIRGEWDDFQRRYMAPEGYVLDRYNGGAPHSEGQGYALLVAAEAGDLASFERIHAWTATNLRRRPDGLHAWRHRPDSATPVGDSNNATDGDIMIAWALMRAAERFSRPAYDTEAAAIAAQVIGLCTMEMGQRLVLLPGRHGFVQRGHVTLNPSYYIFPALLDFEALVPTPRWRQLVADGLETCCRQAAFGRWSLPADWIEVPRDVAEPTRLATDKPARFSFDALRVPLHLAWGGRIGEPALHKCGAFWDDPVHRGQVPAWVDLHSDGMSPYPGHAGVVAVARLARAVAAGQRTRPDLPRVAQATDYYGAALTLLARVAWNDLRTGAGNGGRLGT